jgi:outer membrane immunogenic protein
MKRSLLGLVFIGAVAAAPAMAADMGMPLKAPPLPPPAASWTGCYVGIEGGGNWGSSKSIDASDRVPADVGLPITNPFNLSGGLFGGTVGCNYQFASRWVIGIEDDFSWTNKTGSAFDLPPFNTASRNTMRENWLDTMRGRIGYGSAGWLFYVTGGAAFAGTTVTLLNMRDGNSVTDSSNRTGWTAGGGIEWAFLPNWSLKAEYLFADFGSSQYINPPVVIGTDIFNSRNVLLTDNIVRVGINYRFNWSGPVSTRY